MTAPLIVWPGSDDLTARAGQCYTLSMELVLDNLPRFGLSLFLVHGVMHADRSPGFAEDWREHNPGLPLPPPNPHAWVEIEADGGTLAVDPIPRQGWPIAEHRVMYGAETIRRYRADIAVTVAARNDHYGPWDKRSLEAWRERQRIARVDPRFSQGAGIARLLSRKAPT